MSAKIILTDLVNSVKKIFYSERPHSRDMGHSNQD